MSRARMLCGVAIFAGVAAFGYVCSDPLSDFVSDHCFNGGKTAMMEAEAGSTFKALHQHAMMATGAHVASVAKMATK